MNERETNDEDLSPAQLRDALLYALKTTLKPTDLSKEPASLKTALQMPICAPKERGRFLANALPFTGQHPLGKTFDREQALEIAKKYVGNDVSTRTGIEGTGVFTILATWGAQGVGKSHILDDIAMFTDEDVHDQKYLPLAINFNSAFATNDILTSDQEMIVHCVRLLLWCAVFRV